MVAILKNHWFSYHCTKPRKIFVSLCLAIFSPLWRWRSSRWQVRGGCDRAIRGPDSKSEQTPLTPLHRWSLWSGRSVGLAIIPHQPQQRFVSSTSQTPQLTDCVPETMLPHARLASYAHEFSIGSREGAYFTPI